MKPFKTIGPVEARAVLAAMDDAPLSGYLAGKERGGKHVCALEDAWCETFGVRHAIAVNSATSGLLAAAFAVGLGRRDRFAVSAMTMSATAAAPMFTGATPFFCDVEDETFGINCGPMPDTTKAIFSTNLFGYPNRTLGCNEWDKRCGVFLIEDNAQSPFAMSHGGFAGTMGHIGVWSLNIHKPIQCGEGGMVTTDDDGLAGKMRNFINHGENAGEGIGLNLRMPELCAAVALAQLRRGPEIIRGRVEQAEAILDAIGEIPGLRKPVVREGCTHVYYTIPFVLEKNRTAFCASLRENGIPIEEGYIEPLYRLPAFKSYATSCPVAEDLQDRRLFYVENCAWDLTRDDIWKVGDAFKRAGEKWL